MSDIDDVKFSDYKRVTDTLLYLDINYSLIFTTVLSYKDKNGCDSFFQSEWLGQDGGISIYRQIKCYYVIQEKNTFGGGFLLWPQDVYFLCKTIEDKLFPWFFGDNPIFTVQEDKLYITDKHQNVQFIRSMEQYLNIVPTIINYKDGTEKEGVTIYVSSPDKSMDLDLDKLMNLYYILKNSDMMNMAYNALAYAKIQPYGTNLQRSSGGLGGVISNKSVTSKWDDTYKRGDNKGERKFTPSKFLKNVKPKETE